jgi:DNA/RNA-binding domain of Phe-tRNA-synthetase-like protein
MTMTAPQWIETARVEPAIFERWPNYRLLLIAADNVDTVALQEAAHQLISEATTFARALDPAVSSDHITRRHEAYRDFGVKPRVGRVSVDALTRRASSDTGLPRINVLVDLYNAISVLCQVPIGGEDLHHYSGAARLVIATGNEPFHTNANGAPTIEHPDPGEPIWADNDGVTCRRWNWRQTIRTAIGTHTTSVGFIIDSLDAPHHNGAKRATQQLLDLLGTNLTRTIDDTNR